MESSPEPQQDLPAYDPSTDVTLPPDLEPRKPAGPAFLFGRFGLRAGYGMAIFCALFLLANIIAGIAAVAATGHLHEVIAQRMQMQAHPNAPKPHLHLNFVPMLAITSDGVTFLILLAAAWVFSKAERRKLWVYGIGRQRWKDFLPGAFWGLVCLSALVGVLRSLHLLVFDGQALHGSAIWVYGAKWLLAFLCVGLMEEYAFRGYLQFTLMRGVWGLARKIDSDDPRKWAFWMAATILSLLFGVAHMGNGGETAFGLLAVFLAGMTFSYALWRTGSLWWAIGFHMTWDWAQSFLFGVADSGNVSIGRLFVTHPMGKPLLSGGPDGPEGSVFVVGALLLTVIILRLTTRGAVQPPVEQLPRVAEPVMPVYPGTSQVLS